MNVIKKPKKPKVGDKIKFWGSGRADGMSTILAVRKYDGRYKEYFNWIVTLTAEGTIHGQIEMAME